MTDLSAKFQGLRTDATDSVRETNALLASIKGDGPDSIVDLAAALNLNTQTLVDIRSLLEQLATTIEVLNNNAATNTRAITQSISLNACACDIVSAEPPFDSHPGEIDCDSVVVPSLGPGQTSAEYPVTLPDRVVQFGPPRTIHNTDVIFFARYPANEEFNIAKTLDECPYYGEAPAGDWFVSIINTGNDNVGSQPVGWCWSTTVEQPDTACARAQAVIAGFEAILNAFANIPDTQPLTKSAINLAFAAGSGYIEARPPDTLTVNNLLNIYNNTEGGFHYGLLPSGFSSDQKYSMVASMYAAQDASVAGTNVLDYIEDTFSTEAPYKDFVKSIPQQFWFNAVFNPESAALNEAPFDNGACEPA